MIQFCFITATIGTNSDPFLYTSRAHNYALKKRFARRKQGFALNRDNKG